MRAATALTAIVMTAMAARGEMTLTPVDSIATGVTSLTFHVRAKASGSRPSHWGLVWNYTSPLSYRTASVTIPPLTETDGTYPTPVKVEIAEIEGETTRTIHSATTDIHLTPGSGFSLKLVSRVTGTLLVGGSDKAAFEIPVDFDRTRPGLMATVTHSQVSFLRATVDYQPTAPIRFFEGDIDAYLATSDDPLECVWSYFDRDTDPARANPGGEYTLATVRDGEGYAIVYLGGARVNPDYWERGQIRGRLVPTVFLNHFDLIWTDSHGEEMRGDQNATIENASLLTLSFTLYGARIRFARATPDRDGVNTQSR